MKNVHWGSVCHSYKIKWQHKMKVNYFTAAALFFNIILSTWMHWSHLCTVFIFIAQDHPTFYLDNIISLVFQVTEFNKTLYRLWWQKTETVLKTPVYLLFNQRMWLLPQEKLYRTQRICNIGMLLLFTCPACICSRLTRWHNVELLNGATYFI
jgi:hypothetical protein